MSEVKVYSRPKSWMPDVSSHYCPGCGHGIAHRLVCEVIDELGIQNDAIGLAPVGCAAMIYDYIDTDFCEAPHGRAPAVATGRKAVRPDKIVYTYQGDGDLASIGMGEIVHAANRGMNLTVIFINNAIYGMTGGQMAPTTLIGQRASTCPLGRDVKVNGYPIRVSEMLAALPAPGYIARVTVAQPKYITKAKQAVRQAFQNRMWTARFSLGRDTSSSCPTNWGMRPWRPSTGWSTR